MCGAVSGNSRKARSWTIITTPALRVAGGRKFVARRTSKSPNHSRRGTPAREEIGSKTRAGNGELLSEKFLARTSAKNLRGRTSPFACRYQAV